MTQFISTTEAAKIVGISRVALFKRIKSGTLKATKVGRNYIIDRAEVESGGQGISPSRKDEIDRGVKKVVDEYEETLRLLK